MNLVNLSRDNIEASFEVLVGGCHTANTDTAGGWIPPVTGDAEIRVTVVVAREGDVEVRIAQRAGRYGLHVCRGADTQRGFFYPAAAKVGPEAVASVVALFKRQAAPPPVWRPGA